MNIVKFWHDQIDKWNTEQKCGLCWDFGAPLIESAVNVQQPEKDKDCCIKAMFLQDKGNAFSTTNQFSNTGFVNQVTCTESFELLLLFDSSLGINNYNEIKGHSIDESLWETKMNPIKECLQCDANLDFCVILGSQYRITNWSARQVINYLDSVYCGYRLSVTFQTFN